MPKPYKTITLRLNAGEYAHLQEQAAATGLKMEPLLRQLIMGVNLRPRPPDTYAALLRELSTIGNNINQLAHQANARDEATKDEISEAARLVRQTTRPVKPIGRGVPPLREHNRRPSPVKAAKLLAQFCASRPVCGLAGP